MMILRRAFMVLTLLYTFSAFNVYTGEEAETAAIRQGYSLRLSGETVVSFVPETSGLWVVETSDQAPGTAWLTMELDGHSISIGRPDLHSSINVWLNEGLEYDIFVHFIDTFFGELYLTVRHIPTETMPPEGKFELTGSVIIGFTPDVSGYWVFEALGYGVYPSFSLFDGDRWIRWDQARINTLLREGQEYGIFVDFGHVAGQGYLSARHMPIMELPIDETVYVSGAFSYLSLVPDRSGFWAIEVSGLDTNESVGLILYYPGFQKFWQYRVSWNSDRIMEFLHEGREYILTVVDQRMVSDSTELGIRAFPLPVQVLEPGSSLRITDGTIVSFTPDATGIWAVETSELMPGTWARVLLFYQGEFIGDVGGENVRAFILHEGVEIIMTAGFRIDIYGEYSLSAYMFPIMEMQPSETLVVSHEDIFFSFVPDFTAEWELEVSACDAVVNFSRLIFAIITLNFEVVGIEYDLLAEKIWLADLADSEFTSAAISAVLTEGETYFITIWNPARERLNLSLRQLP